MDTSTGSLLIGAIIQLLVSLLITRASSVMMVFII